MKREKFGTLDKKRNDSVFVAFATEIVLPEMYGQDAGKIVNICMMQSRWDGRMGFVGGKVDKNETLIEAALREVEEEIGEKIKDSSQLIPVCSHSFLAGEKTMNTHLYLLTVTPEKIKELISNSKNAKDFLTENCGNIVFHTMNYGNKGFELFMRNNFASTVKEEILILIKEHLNSELNFSKELLSTIDSNGL